jgi:hypothetical protein
MNSVIYIVISSFRFITSYLDDIGLDLTGSKLF